MALVVDYFLSPQSPWAYLGHVRFVHLAQAAGAQVAVRPMDLGGAVFPVSGGLPLAKRSSQRQAYRLIEMRRFAEHLGMPINLHPRFFPVVGDDAARLIEAVNLHDGADAALTLTGALLRAVWAEDRNIADTGDLAAMLTALHLPAQRLDDMRAPDIQALYAADTQRAIDAGVFGAPSYVVDNEIFWGQDRLDFLGRRLARG